MKLDSSVSAIVSGGASGLGFAVASALRKAGVRVGIIDLNKEQGAEAASQLGCEAAQADVRSPDSIANALEALRKVNGQERICVNCAGIAPSAKTVSKGAAHDPDLFAQVLSINLAGTFYLASQSAQGMTSAEPIDDDNQRGVIVNTASIAAFEGQMGQAAYAASKAGVAGLTLPMARDLAAHGIRVLSVAPGIFGTPMVRAFPETVQEALASNIPFPKRLGHPAEFADLILSMIRNPMLNGETIRIDGATRMQAR